MYAINPREAKYDPRTIAAAAKIFWAAGESWTMPSEGWDQTNFGLFSGDDQLGGTAARRVYEKMKELGAKRIVISECGHGYRSTRCEGPNWAGIDQDFEMESSIFTMLRYIKEGRIVVDRTKLAERVTYHDSCNLARSCGITEEPRELLRAGGDRLRRDDAEPRRELLLHRRRRRDVDVRVHAAAPEVGEGQGRPDRGDRRQDRGDLLPQLRRRAHRPDQALQARLRGQAARGPRRRRARHRGVRGDEEPKVVVEMPKPALPLQAAGSWWSTTRRTSGRSSRTVLEDAGAEVYEAADGDQALALARQAQAGPDHPRPVDGGQGRHRDVRRAALRRRTRRASRCASSPAIPSSARSSTPGPCRRPNGYMDKPIKEERAGRERPAHPRARAITRCTPDAVTAGEGTEAVP